MEDHGCGKRLRTVKEVRDGVVTHVNRGITERLDQELLVPWHLGAQTEPTSASPLIQPIQRSFESMSRLTRVRLHILEQPVRESNQQRGNQGKEERKLTSWSVLSIVLPHNPNTTDLPN